MPMRVRVRKKRAQGLNENYGRELMELHTLGVDGGYTQQDVTEVARCFTGWTIREPQRGGGFEFNARLHDKGEKHVLGVTIPAGGGMDDGLKVLDISGAPSLHGALHREEPGDRGSSPTIRPKLGGADGEDVHSDRWRPARSDADHAGFARVLGSGELPVEGEVAARDGGERGARGEWRRGLMRSRWPVS